MSSFKMVLMWLIYIVTFSIIYATYSMVISGDWLLGVLRLLQADLEYGPVFGFIYDTLRTATCLILNGLLIHSVYKLKNNAGAPNCGAANSSSLKPKTALILWLAYYLTFAAMLESLIAFTPYEWKIWLVSTSTGEHIAELGCEYDAEFELMIVALAFNCAFIYITSTIWNGWRRNPKAPAGEP
ncbi:hypothetical protein [Pseudomonas knackmussii]|uniref:hypothetical protein n=1 Tax=Pseudomonas knackmussii TaxID=65741 RepID=UPI001363618D|nr:hypothetical protein [Pseudomonas knackmussii]